MRKIIGAIIVVSLLLMIQITSYAEPPPVDGFIGVPWGASREAVEKAMAERYFPKDPDSKADKYIYNGYYAGYQAYVTFYFINNQFFEGGASLIDVFRDAKEGDYRHLVDQYFSAFETLLIQKYGNPSSRYPGTNEPWKPRSITWEIQDQNTSITINLVKNYAFKDKTCDINSRVFIAYKNNSLQQKEIQRSKDQDI
jgi:hypothetical protein